MKRLAQVALLATLPSGSCRSRQDAEPDLVEGFLNDPRGITRRVAAMDDPVHQETAILRLSEAYPGRTGDLCRHLSDRSTAEYCERLSRRPHLVSIMDKKQSSSVPSLDRAGGGPPTGSTPFSKTLMQTWVEVEPDPGVCAPEDAVYHPCLWSLAREAARGGDARAAAAACNAARDVRSRSDCFFTTAEDTAGRRESYGTAAVLCQGSGAFVHECNGHLLMRVVKRQVRNPDAAAGLTASATRVAEAWQEIAPELEAVMLDLYWAMATERLMGPGKPVNGDLFGALPPEAWPHLRDTMAWQMAGCDDPLEALVEASHLRGAEGMRCSTPSDSPQDASRRSRLRDQRDGNFAIEWLRWSRDLEGEDEIPATYFLMQGTGRRATDPDPSTDLLLAGLNVQAYHEPVPLDLLASYVDDERLVVRWTAVRILAALAPDHPALERAAEDPDPRVRRRARVQDR